MGGGGERRGGGGGGGEGELKALLHDIFFSKKEKARPENKAWQVGGGEGAGGRGRGEGGEEVVRNTVDLEAMTA